MIIIPPSDWNPALPTRPQVAFNPSTKRAISHHNVGALKIDESYPSDKRARSVVDYHQQKNGWSWGSYSYLVGADARIFGLKMLNSESYSDGLRPKFQRHTWEAQRKWWNDVYGPRTHRSWNHLHVSILWMIGMDFEPPDAMVRAVQGLVTHIHEDVPSIVANVPHKGLTRKTCPERHVTRIITSGALGPHPLNLEQPWPREHRLQPIAPLDYVTRAELPELIRRYSVCGSA